MFSIFFWDLNGSFSHVCGQILLNEPIPSLAHVLSLNTQSWIKNLFATLQSNIISYTLYFPTNTNISFHQNWARNWAPTPSYHSYQERRTYTLLIPTRNGQLFQNLLDDLQSHNATQFLNGYKKNKPWIILWTCFPLP